MKAVHIPNRNQVEFVDLTLPDLKPGEALIEIMKISLCGSDVWMLSDAPAEDYPHPVGVSGHEVVGRVLEINDPDEQAHFAVGEIVMVIAPALDAMCTHYIAEFVNILSLPKGLPLEHALQAQQIGTVIYACQKLPNMIGKTAVVIGQGSAGIWFNIMLKRLGAAKVVGIDKHNHRAALSEQFGAADGICNAELSDVEASAQVQQLLGQAPDVVIDAAGTESAINLAIELLGYEGFLLGFGVPHKGDITIADYYALHRKCITLCNVVGATIGDPTHECTYQALELLASGVIDPTPLLTHEFVFTDVEAAYALQANPQSGAVKIVVNVV